MTRCRLIGRSAAGESIDDLPAAELFFLEHFSH